MTKTELLSLYREALAENAYWAVADPSRLEKFLNSFWETITTNKTTWSNQSPTLYAIWKKHKIPGKMTYKALRALPLNKTGA
jgi:hypothetical protein